MKRIILLSIMAFLAVNAFAQSAQIFTPDEYEKFVDANKLRSEGKEFFVCGKVMAVDKHYSGKYKVELDYEETPFFNLVCLFEKKDLESIMFILFIRRRIL